VKTLLTSLMIVAMIVAIIFRSLWAGIIASIPLGFAITLTFGVMCWTGIPLDIATSLVASIVLGVGVDDTIHYLLRFSRGLKQSGNDARRAMMETFRTSGRAMLYTSTALVGGFMMFVLSDFIPVQYFGGLTALSLFASTIGALFLLPIILLLVKPRFVGFKKTQNGFTSSTEEVKKCASETSYPSP